MFDFSPENLDNEFPVRRSLIYLNHAAIAPPPRRVADEIVRHTRETSEFGVRDWKTWYRRYDEVRAQAAAFIGARADQISFLPSTSHSINMVALGLDWRAGDNVVGDDLEFPTNAFPWMNLESRGVEYRRAESREGFLEAADITRLADSRTRVIAVSWVAFHNGFVFPLEELGRFCRDRNILLVVDGIQGLGVLPIDVASLGIDVLAADSHKFLYGAEACATFFASDRAHKAIRTPWLGWWNVRWNETQLSYRLDLHTGGRHYEAGSLPTAQLFGLSAAMGLLTEIGQPAIEERVIGLVARLRSGLESLGWKIATPKGSRSAILAAIPPGGNAYAAHVELQKNGVVTAVRESAVRFSPHVGNDEGEIDRVIEALRGFSRA